MTLNIFQKGFMEAIYRPVQGLRSTGLYDITFEGKENLLELGKGGIQLCNHQSMLDIPVEMLGIIENIGLYPYHVIRPMPLVELVGGLTVTRPKDVRNGALPIKAKGVIREKVIPLANEGQIITIFPEGTRKPIGTKTQIEETQLRTLQQTLQEADFRKPVVPTCITYDGDPSISRIRANVVYGEPIDTGNLRQITEQLNEFYRRVQN